MLLDSSAVFFLAAEERFISFLLEGIPFDQGLVNRYRTMRLVLSDYNDDDIHAEINTKLDANKHFCNPGLISNLFLILSNQSADYAHKQDRDPDFFRNLNSDDAKRIVSDPTLGLKKKETKFILDFHTFTSKQK
jgi:hypothetical protein